LIRTAQDAAIDLMAKVAGTEGNQGREEERILKPQ
jgi:hypothetical protein